MHTLFQFLNSFFFFKVAAVYSFHLFSELIEYFDSDS